ncbi:DUF2520 domain-containing protein [Nakamurella sp. YIM 132087]|uniref:DUF2520 domain-containing protein n=1 Tax=Nakamurella alba TaxID=2665158 RepID=A0A7K1FN98_9ACTN|nr:DUF2520 domain-containing protein [Nakamurella alba]
MGLVGAGRVGVVLTSALAAAGHPVAGVHARSDASWDRASAALGDVRRVADPTELRDGSVGLLLLAVSDTALPSVVAELAAAGRWDGVTAAHVAGTYGIGVLDPLTAQGAEPLAVHPAMTFTGAVDLETARLRGSRFAITGSPAGAAVGTRLVLDVGGVPVAVPEQARSLYHAAVVHACNHVVTLIAQAGEMLRAAGVDDPEVLRASSTAALDNALKAGIGALTGPVSRADTGTLHSHLAAIGAATPDALDSYLTLARATADLAAAAGRLDPAGHAAVLAALPGPDADQR